MLAGYGGSSPLASQSDISAGRGSGGPGHSGTPARPQPAPTPPVFPPTGPSMSRRARHVDVYAQKNLSLVTPLKRLKKMQRCIVLVE